MPFAGRSTAVAAMAEAQRLEIIHPDILVKEAMAEAAAWDAEEEARVAALQPPAGEETLEDEDATGANHVGAPTEDAPVEDAPDRGRTRGGRTRGGRTRGGARGGVPRRAWSRCSARRAPAPVFMTSWWPSMRPWCYGMEKSRRSWFGPSTRSSSLSNSGATRRS
jgi:hypothetical protein